MPGKRPSSTPRVTTAPSKPSPSILVGLLRPRILLTLSILLFIGVFAPYAPRLIPNLKGRPEYRVDSRSIAVPGGHEWIPADVVQESFEGRDPLLSLLEPETAETVARELQKHPWVDRVNRVSVNRNGTISADLSYRKPVAFIEASSGLYPVDADGVLLPPKDFSPQDAEAFPHIRNVSSAPPRQAGLVWEDAVVKGGAKIADRLTPGGDRERIWKRFGLVGIAGPRGGKSVSGAAVDQISFELLTSAGSRIQWGKAPGADDLEPTFDQKIGRLQHYLATYGSFDKPQGPYDIDIRGFEAISLYPLDSKLYR
jgi:hypothetical protein